MRTHRPILRLPSAFGSLRSRLILIVLAALLPSLVFTLYTGFDERQRDAQSAQHQALRLSQQVAAEQHSRFENARPLLSLLAALPEVTGGAVPGCENHLADLMARNAPYSSLMVVHPNGDLYCSLPRAIGPLNYADRSWFQRVLQSHSFMIGDYTVSRLTGKPNIVLGYPVLDEGGSLVAVVAVGLDLGWLQTALADAPVPAGTTLTMLDRSGTILARYPQTEGLVGSNRGADPSVQTVLTLHEGTAELGGLNGVPQLVAFAPLYSDELGPSAYVYTEVPQAIAYADADRQLTRNLAALALVAAIALLATWSGGELFVLRHVSSILLATQRLSRGDLSARIGMAGGAGELTRLAQAFDDMAAALENQARERKQWVGDTQQRLREMEALDRISTALRTANALDPMLARVLDETLSVFDTTAGSLWLYEPACRQLRRMAGRGWPAELVDRQDLGEGIMGHVFVSGEPYLVPDIQANTHTFAPIRPQVPPGWAALAVPIRAASDTIGTLCVSVRSARRFSDIEVHLLATIAEMAGGAIQRMRLHEQTEQRLQQVQAMHATNLAITSSLDMRVTLGVLLDQVTTQLGVGAADILLFNRHAQTLEYAAGRGFLNSRLEHTSVRLGECVAGQAVLERRVLAVPDLRQSDTACARTQLLAAEGFISYFAVPLIAKGQVKGVLDIFQRDRLEPDPLWLDFLHTLAGQAAIAIDNALLFTDLERANLDLRLAYDTTIEGWSRALELRDQETEGHAQRVTELTLELARELGIAEVELEHIRRARYCTTSARWEFRTASC